MLCCVWLPTFETINDPEGDDDDDGAIAQTVRTGSGELKVVVV